MIDRPSRIPVRVHPGARRAAVRGRRADGALRIDVTEAPEAGRANAAVCALVAELLGVRAGDVKVLRGATSRSKLLEVESLEAAEVERRLSAAEGAADAD